MSLVKYLKLSFLTLVLASLGSTSAIADSPTTYNNMFISYVSPADVITLAKFANKKQLGGYIIWTAQGDTNPVSQSSTSLLAALNNTASQHQEVMAYWTNWSNYGAAALPINSYPIPGSSDGKDGTRDNADLSAKLGYIDTLTYAFLEIAVAPADASSALQALNGTIYFNDPWADLLPTDPFCTASVPGGDSSCTYAVKAGKAFADSAKYGNFEAFAVLPKTYSNLNTMISIGGYKHDNGFEVTFGNDAYSTNFTNSAVSIISHYNLSGIDLDYENPNMTNAQSNDYLNLITALNNAMPAGKYITVTMLAGPDYLNGKNGIGFAPGVLAKIAGLAHVKHINLMTYDFHGAFDYTGDSNGKTGFLSNTHMPTDAPAGYDPKFSVETSVQALLDQGVPAAKIGVGIPAYGRALSNIQPNANGGLFQTLGADTLIPAGDLDQPGCSQTVPLSDSSCSGSFTYSYIIENMLSSSFTATDHKDSSHQHANGTTAFAATFSPATTPNYTLEITNTGVDGDAAFQVVISDGSSSAFTSDSLNLADSGQKSDVTYDANTNPSTSTILAPHNRNLTIQWTTWNHTGQCPGAFDFTTNTHVMISIPNTAAQPTAVCEVK